MRYLTIAVLVVMLLGLGVSAYGAHVEEPGINLESINMGYDLERTPDGNETTELYENFSFCNKTYRVKLSLEYYSDGYDRYTLYAGKKSSPTMGLVRWDDSSRLWLGFNHVQPISNELTLILRPLKGVNAATCDRAYLIADYQLKGEHLGAMFLAVGIEGDGKAEDYYLGPTYRDGGWSFWAATHLTKDDFYLDASYSMAFK